MRLLILVASMVLIHWPASAEAQRARPSAAPARPARFFGTVIDAITLQPIPGARLASSSFSQIAVSDSAGRFDIPGIPAGLVRFHVTASGYPRVSFTLAFASGEEMERQLELDSSSVAPAERAQALPQVTVEAAPEAPTWLRDFERRRSTGRGQYLTRDQIESTGGGRLSDVVQNLRGVTLECGGGGGSCRIRMTRAPMQCYPEYYVDGLLNNSWGPVVPLRDLEAIEIYTGPSDTPGEFAGRNSGCGTIVIWTRSGPRAQRRP